MPSIIPTLYVGLGGTGFYAISEIKRTIADKYFQGDPNFPLTSYLAIDTEFLTVDKMDGNKSKEEINFMRTFDANNIREVERIETRVTPDAVKRTLQQPSQSKYDDFVPAVAADAIEVGGDGASGIGLIGKIALADNFAKVAGTVKAIAQDLMGNDTLNRLKFKGMYASYKREDRINVFIFCSFGGGTGKGMSLIFAAMCKEILARQFSNQRDKFNISIINYLPECFRARGRSLASDPATYNYILKNQYATYKEFEWCLTHGYTNEEFFKAYFKKQGSNPKTEGFINTIYNISPKLENRGAEVSSYQSLNQIVSQVFSFLVMNEDSKHILTTTSNDTSKKDSAVPEKDTGLVRNLKYCRLGRYSLVMPEYDLFEYAKLYFAESILRDFMGGGLEDRVENLTYDELMMAPNDHKYHPHTHAVTKQGELDDIFTSAFRHPVEVTEGELHFPNDAHSYQTQIYIKPMEEAAGSFERRANGFFEKEKRAEKVNLEIIDEHLKLLTKGLGIKICRDFLQFVEEKLANKVQYYLEQTKATGELNAAYFLRGLAEANPYATDTNLEYFQFSVGAKVLSRLREEFENRLTHVRDGINHERFGSATELIEKVLPKKKKGIIPKLFGSDDDERIPFPEEAKRMIGAEIRKYNGDIKKLWPLYQAYQYLDYAIRVQHHIAVRQQFLATLIGRLDKNEEDEYQEHGQLADIQQKMRSLASLKSEANENYVVGDNENEFRGFCQDILPHEDIMRDLHVRFNTEIVDDLFGPTGKQLEQNLYPKVTGYSEDRLRPERFTEHRGKRDRKWSITNYLKFLSQQRDPTLKQQIEENLRKMMHSSDFLCALDSNRFTDPGRAMESFPQQNFLEMTDKDFLAQSVPGWQTYTHHAKPIEQEDEERITLTRVQGLIPLFAFTDLQEAKDLYLADLNETNDDKERQRRLVKRHTSSFFMSSITEPFGETLQLDNAEMKSIWNMAFHLGVVDVDEKGYIKIVESALRNNLVHFLDPNRMNRANSRDKYVRVTEFQDNFGEFYHLINKINTLIFERLDALADDVSVGQIILHNYLTQMDYPVLPKALYDLATNSQEGDYPELRDYLGRKGQEYIDVYSQYGDKVFRTRSFALDKAQLREIFDKADDHTAFFDGRVGTSTGAGSGPVDISQVTDQTTWQLVSARDKKRAYNDMPPTDYASVLATYQEASSGGVFTAFYSPDIDLLLTHEQFQKEIGPLFREYLVYSKDQGGYMQTTPRGFECKDRLGAGSNAMLSIFHILKLLPGDSSLRLSEKLKPTKTDWIAWEEEPYLSSHFQGVPQQGSGDFEEVEAPDF